MMKIILIIPYFGKFPSYFQLFLNSCRANSTIDWILITDIKTKYNYPTNVKVIDMSFTQLQHLIQSKFDFPVAIDTPYKLCDYRPAYGYIFEEYISEYDFWGYCDVDLLFGNLRNFFCDKQLEKYDKIGHLGHLSIYRNNPIINRVFMSVIDGVHQYEEVFSLNNSFIFDEWDDLSINRIFLKKGFRVWIWNDFFDVYPYRDNLQRVIWEIDSLNPNNIRKKIDGCENYVTWEKGYVYLYNYIKGKWKKEELAYVHFQKRDMLLKCDTSADRILCLSNRFERFENNICFKYRCKNWLHKIIDYKRIVHWYKCVKYQIIVVTAPIRHCFKRRRN